jgi:hypothetical protein
MTLAIYANKFDGSSDGMGGGGLNTLEGDRTSKQAPTGKNFKEAFAIARGMLTDYKHLTPASKHGAIGKIHLTGSGRQLELKHRREQSSLKKSARFDMLYMKYIATPSGDKPSDKAKEKGAAATGKTATAALKGSYSAGFQKGYHGATGKKPGSGSGP